LEYVHVQTRANCVKARWKTREELAERFSASWGLGGWWQSIPYSYSWNGITERSFSKNALQPRHSEHRAPRSSGPKSWSGSGNCSQWIYRYRKTSNRSPQLLL